MAGNTASNNRANEINLYETNLTLSKHNILGSNSATRANNFERTDSDGTPNLPLAIDSSNFDGSSDEQNALLSEILRPLANNGGMTQTHDLIVGSPAINFGDNSSCVASDQRGGARANNSSNGCDAGAIELAVSDLSEMFFVVPTKIGKTVIFSL